MDSHYDLKRRQLLLLLGGLLLLTWVSPSRAGGWLTTHQKGQSATPTPTCMAPSTASSSPTMFPPQASASASPTMCQSVTPSPSPTMCQSATPSAPASPSSSPTMCQSATPSASPSSIPSESPSPSPSPSESASPSPSASPSASPSPVQSPSATPTVMCPSPSASPQASASASASASPTMCQSVTPSPSPTMCQSASPSPSPTMCQSAAPSRSPKHHKCHCHHECECECECECKHRVTTPQQSMCPTTSPAVPSPTGQPTTCPPNNQRLGQAAPFSAFVVGNSSTSAGVSLDMVNGDFESAAAVRGGLRLRSFGIDQAAACTANESQRYTLIADGGTVDFSNGQLFCGNLLASSDVQILSLPSFGSGSLKVGDVTELSGIDFDEAQRELLDESETLCSAVDEGDVTQAQVDSSGAITFAATGSSTEMFSVSAADLSSATNLRFVGFENQATSDVVVNVVRDPGDSSASLTLSNFGVALGSSLSGRSLLWNICGGTDLVVIQAFQLPGALLAASADVTLQNGQVQGQVVARTLRGSGGGQIINPPCS